MRSTVSYMLSHGSGEPVMSRPDYEQCAYHHGCLLVLLRGIGPSKPRSLQKVFEKVRKVNNVKITDSSGNQRDIWVRYIHDHPVENNDWGDFQTHRRLLGLITIGKFENQIELNELCRLHESLKVKYTSTLYNSRSILFGPSTTLNGSTEVENVNKIENNSDSLNDSLTNSLKRLQDEFTTPSNFKSTAYFYRENDSYMDLELHISEFINSLFWILESKRLERSREKIDKMSLLLAPFEKKDFVGLDLESRNNRKRCVGRVTKNLGDLTLQAGLVAESLNLFYSASETLRAISDSLWLGAAEEGLCAASAILLYPQLRQVDEILHRNSSLQEGHSPNKLHEKRRGGDLTKKVISENSTENTATSNSSSSSSVSSMITSSSSSSLSTTAALNRHDLPGNVLLPEEITLNYRKAIINYSKYSHAAIVETEAALKAARMCIEQNNHLDVSMFLQNILYINLNISEQERIKRFEMLTDLYTQIGFRRKAAFCQRLSAWRHVGDRNPDPDWLQHYKLLLDSFPGYNLSLDPLEVVENQTGWPTLQIDLLQGLIQAAKRLGTTHSAAATRHMTFLLQTQWDNLSINEQGQMAVKLQEISANSEGSPVPLVLENGIVIPPANLTDIPYCMQLQVKDLPPHLRPQKIIITKADSGPFLFTPIHFSSVDRREKKKKDNKIQFYWVQNDMCEVTIKLRNILPFELTINDMRLLTNGIVFEALPQTITLQPSIPTMLTLHGTPIEAGQLEIQGYSTHTLGVKSNCRLKHMKNRKFPNNYLIDVIPALPRVKIETSLPQSASFSTIGSSSDNVITSASLTLYNGQSSECIVTLTNESNITIEHLEVSMTSNIDNTLQNKIFEIYQDNIQSKLPIAPKSSIEFQIKIFGEADFLSAVVSHGAASTHSTGGTAGGGINAPGPDGPHSLNYSVMSSGHASLPSRVSSPTHQFLRKSDVASSFRSSNSGGGHSSLATLSFAQPSQLTTAQSIEAQLKIRYSGGEAMQEGYCRTCAISFSLEMLPSAQITSWDVLPAETATQFYLVLDVSNLTAQEMLLNYTDNKSILIEARESCRVPIPVDRCSLEETSEELLSKTNDVEYSENGIFLGTPTFDELTARKCSVHIAERVNMNWVLTGTENRGLACLKGITLTPSMIDLITVSPLQWFVSFDNTPVQPQSEVVCSAGQSVGLSITVCNQSLSPLRYLALTVQFYQDYLNGVHNYNLETRVTMSGPSQIVIPVLHKDEKAHHECSIIFFTPGRFKANIMCRSLAPICTTTGGNTNSLNNKNTNTLTKSCPINESSQFERNVGLVSDTANFHETQQHIWKFIPPIEVTVIE